MKCHSFIKGGVLTREMVPEHRTPLTRPKFLSGLGHQYAHVTGHWVGILCKHGVDLPEVDAQSPVFFLTITMGELYELFECSMYPICIYLPLNFRILVVVPLLDWFVVLQRDLMLCHV